jgi:hypothetical protein
VTAPFGAVSMLASNGNQRDQVINAVGLGRDQNDSDAELGQVLKGQIAPM